MRKWRYSTQQQIKFIIFLSVLQTKIYIAWLFLGSRAFPQTEIALNIFCQNEQRAFHINQRSGGDNALLSEINSGFL